MSATQYKGFFIAVEAVRYAFGTLLLTPLIKITAAQQGSAPIASLFSTEEFRREKDVEAYGLQMGVNWIDTHLEAAAKTSG